MSEFFQVVQKIATITNEKQRELTELGRELVENKQRAQDIQTTIDNLLQQLSNEDIEYQYTDCDDELINHKTTIKTETMEQLEHMIKQQNKAKFGLTKELSTMTQRLGIASEQSNYGSQYSDGCNSYKDNLYDAISYDHNYTQHIFSSSRFENTNVDINDNDNDNENENGTEFRIDSIDSINQKLSKMINEQENMCDKWLRIDKADNSNDNENGSTNRDHLNLGINENGENNENYENFQNYEISKNDNENDSENENTKDKLSNDLELVLNQFGNEIGQPSTYQSVVFNNGQQYKKLKNFKQGLLIC